MGELIALLSGKGGTGKTSVCAGLGTALAEQGNTVLCIDCDVGLRNLDIALGLAQADALSFMDICRGDHSLEQALRHSRYPKLSFLTAPVCCGVDSIDRGDFCALLRKAREAYDYVLLDAPAGIEKGFALCAAYADLVLLVTCPEPAAVRDAARAGQELELLGAPEVRLVVNRVSKKLFKIMNITVDDVIDEAGLPLLGILPEDSSVPLAAAFQEPLLRYRRRGAAATACRRMAKRLRGEQVPLPNR